MGDNLDEIQELFKEHRTQIDALDETIIDALALRFKVVHDVGRIKAKKGICVVQSERAENVKQRAMRLAKEKGLDPSLIRHIYTLLIEHAHILENEYKNEYKDD